MGIVNEFTKRKIEFNFIKQFNKKIPSKVVMNENRFFLKEYLQESQHS